MNGILKITNTLEVLCDCWNKAETALQDDIRNNLPDIGEEIITLKFHEKFSEFLKKASSERRIESAFLKDLEKFVSISRYDKKIDPERIAKGLIAEVTLHERQTEKLTGGDLGLMVVRPNVFQGFSNLRICDYRRGLLVQAKLKWPSGWGTFTENQVRLLPERLEYLALLLYSYSDIERYNLSSFRWQLCNDFTLNQLKDLLRRDSFIDSLDSCQIIKGLGDATIGTDNDSIIDEVICPIKNRSLTITITWPDGKHPGSELKINTRNSQKGTPLYQSLRS